MAQGSILTTIGLQKLASATPENQLQITHLAVGDGDGGWAPLDPGMTALVNETWRGAASAPIRAPESSQTLIFETIIPGNIGGFTIRELGIFDADGDLIAIGQTGATEKPAAGGNSQLTLTVRLRVRLQNADQVTLVYQDVPYIDHQGLGNRSAEDAHPIESITGLVEALEQATEEKLGRLKLSTEEMVLEDNPADMDGETAMSPVLVYRSIVRHAMPRGRVTHINASASLTRGHQGMVFVDATSGHTVVTLPDDDGEILDFFLRRVDNTGNRLVVQAAGTDRIKFHTHLRAEGYPFLVLMGSGDYWHLRSDGAGNWWPIARLDSDALGRPVFETTTLFSPGGWGPLAGVVFNRAEWPWLWDHAQQSGMLMTEAARTGMEGGWTSGDGVATFRGPEGRGEFLRLLDDDRGLDASRAAGSRQAGTILVGDNNETPSIFGYKNARDMAADAPPAGAAVQTLQTITSTGINETTVSGRDYLGVVRPVNIAYPGRIKLI